MNQDTLSAGPRHNLHMIMLEQDTILRRNLTHSFSSCMCTVAVVVGYSVHATPSSLPLFRMWQDSYAIGYNGARYLCCDDVVIVVDTDVARASKVLSVMQQSMVLMVEEADSFGRKWQDGSLSLIHI